MLPLDKYPFKAMISIIEYLHSSKEKSTPYNIQRASNSCLSDTLEILNMLEYLTAQGKFVETSEGWTKKLIKDLSPKKPGRFYYLEGIFQIISLFKDGNALSVENISKILSIDKEEILPYLKFLEIITKYGYIKSEINNYQYEY
ncbi:MAG: hypothetical protein ACFFD1_05060, partial [Candidatus Thorarchaeota archaeon]